MTMHVTAKRLFFNGVRFMEVPLCNYYYYTFTL